MTTVAQVIDQALKDIGAVGEGDSASSEAAYEALDTLNQMLALWQAENCTVYAQQITSFSPTGAVSYSVGTSQTVNMTRPERIQRVTWRDTSSVDTEVAQIPTFEQYETAIADKTEAGTPPEFWHYLPSYPYGTLYLYPQPSTGTIRLMTEVRLPQETLVTSTLSLPPEYILPVRYGLASLLAVTYGSPRLNALSAMADRFKRQLRRSVQRTEPLRQTGWPFSAGQRNNILTDG